MVDPFKLNPAICLVALIQMTQFPFFLNAINQAKIVDL
jgi:hypothetical protein